MNRLKCKKIKEQNLAANLSLVRLTWNSCKTDRLDQNQMRVNSIEKKESLSHNITQL